MEEDEKQVEKVRDTSSRMEIKRFGDVAEWQRVFPTLPRISKPLHPLHFFLPQKMQIFWCFLIELDAPNLVTSILLYSRKISSKFSVFRSNRQKYFKKKTAKILNFPKFNNLTLEKKTKIGRVESLLKKKIF